MSDLLFHYTSPEGLLGILTSRCLWATDIRYLNDSAELAYAVELAKSKVSQRHMTDDRTSYISFLLERGFAEIDRPSVYVTGLSEEPDLLSQWRGYCPPTGGFAVGFDKMKLFEYARLNDIAVKQCTYDTDSHEQLVEGLIERIYAEFSKGAIDEDAYNALSPKEQVDYEAGRLMKLTDEHGAPKEEVKSTISAFFNSLMEVAPRLKHPSFSEESEWRLICQGNRGLKRKVEFRCRQSMVVPYMEVGPLDIDVIRQVVIGPCPHKELAELSVQRLTETVLGRRTEVIHSKAPYRNW